MKSCQKCGAYRPGSLTELRHRPQTSISTLPTYVAGTLKIPPTPPKTAPHHQARHNKIKTKPRTALPLQLSSCFDNFAIAKKFHTENLQHQPLPDCVNDNVFTNVHLGRAKSLDSLSSHKLLAKRQDLMSKTHQQCSGNKGAQYGPALGFKEPETHMDLAICWDAPIDPAYEPRRPVHIDGSDGGPAPAVFTLVQHQPDIQNSEHLRPAIANDKKNTDIVRHDTMNCIRPEKRCRTAEVCHCRKEEPRLQHHDIFTQNRMKLLTKYKTEKEEKDELVERQENLEKSLCEGFNDIDIDAEERNAAKRYAKSAEPRNRQKHASYLRNCTACIHKNEEKDLRRTERRSAISVGSQNSGSIRRNGLPANMKVPRPRTPYAKRSFCIDTLTPPFSIVNGCRDADYPEHWRLTSVYQQSYRNPRNRRGAILSHNY